MTHLLVVDDDEDLATLYKEELTDDGYEVTLARSGKAALQSVDDKRPDLVVLDISMPDIDGIEALGKILGKDKTIPVILNTAYGIYKDNFMTWSTSPNISPFHWTGTSASARAAYSSAPNKTSI